MRRIYVLLISTFLSGCLANNARQQKTLGEYSERIQLPEPDLLLRLQNQKLTLENQMSSKELILKVLVKETGKSELTEVIDDQWPNSINCTYNVWTNNAGNVVMIGEYPYSESGDWTIGYVHYFDESERTFCFERNANFYNSLCTDLANETETNYYDSGFQKIESFYILEDSKGNILNKKDCIFNYSYPYAIKNDAESLSTLKSIE